MYFNTNLIFRRGELWRLVTNFFFFGNLGLDFVFHMFFLVKYAKSLEEGSFRGRSADFLWMLMLGGGLLTGLAPLARLEFLGSSLTFMMVYVWGRRHQVRVCSRLRLRLRACGARARSRSRAPVLA